MPLQDQEPKLDDRSFDDIFADLRLRIPRYTKEWTNFNDSDPGITLLQLFAYLSEMMLFRMNQVPRKNYIKFLKLLGQELAPARTATAHLTFTTKADTVALPVPERAQVSAQPTDGGDPLIFETQRALDLIQLPLSDVGVFDGAAFLNVTDANATPGTTFRPFSFTADAGNALYLGFEPPKTPPPAGSTTRLFPREMTFRVFLPPESTAGKPQQATGVSTPPKPPVTLIWEYRRKEGDKNWVRLNTFQDESAACTREGYIRVQGPDTDIQPSTELRLNPKPRYWIRVRVDAGLYPAGGVPVLDLLRPNTVDAINLSTLRGEILGASEGHPNEAFTLRHHPVQELTLQTVNTQGTTQDWKPVADFLSSAATDPHYILNATAGTVQFGDGNNGLIPDAGAQVVAVEYRYGGGLRGNLAGPGSISNPQTVLVGVDKVTNERPAVGGADEETIDDLMVKGPTLLRSRGRAVTPDDFTQLVLETGGIAAALAIPLMHPDHPGVQVPGTTTVVIVPQNEDKPPKPSSDLIQAVCDTLDKYRLITSEVYAEGPKYREIRVEARLTAPAYASLDQTAIDVIDALNKFLDPRKGDFGRALFPTKLYAVILEVTTVRAVETLNVYVDGQLNDGLTTPIPLPPDGLFFGRNHIITVNPEA